MSPTTNAVVVTLSERAERGHYLYEVAHGSSVVFRRFFEFRSLRDEVEYLSTMRRLYVHKFPPNHFKNSLGVKLSLEEATQRARSLSNWTNEVYTRCLKEAWPEDLRNVVLTFVNGTRVYYRGSCHGEMSVDMSSSISSRGTVNDS